MLPPSASLGDNKSMNSEALLIVDFPGHDRIEAQKVGSAWQFKVIGCVALQKEMKHRSTEQSDLLQWSLPTGVGHCDLLIRELILRARGEWKLPYEEVELCHCRNVPTDVVDQAILSGAHECARVSSATSASTACGTCRPDVQKMINYRLGR